MLKIRNAKKKWFSERASWYRDEVMRTLEVLQKSGMRMELNTAGKMTGVGDDYPSKWMLKEAFIGGFQLQWAQVGIGAWMWA